MKKRTLLAATAVAVAGLFGTAPAADAQAYPDYTFDLGIFGGGSWYSAMLDDEHLGENTDNVKYKWGWVTGAQATFWLTPRFGLRANGAFAERPISGGEEAFQDEDGNLYDDVNLWSASGDLMIRLTGPDGYQMGGVSSRPYLALGVGGKNTNPPGDIQLPHPEGEEETGAYFTPATGLPLIQVSEFTLMGLAGLGSDFRLGRNLGLRLEVGDRFWDSTIYDANEYQTNPDEDIGKVVHELYGQLGLHLLFGLQEPEVVAVAPAPPAPAPEPEPEPVEPVEEQIRVCVIDPAAENGVRMVDAVYLPETRDTMVVVDGQRRALTGTLPEVMLANEADWFVRGEPLAIEIAPDYTLEYTTWQSARMIEADELTYLGDVRGVPVYAASGDVTDVQEELADLRDARADNDLAEILEENREMRNAIEDVQYLYVPLRATGCVFQTVRQVEQVRKK